MTDDVEWHEKLKLWWPVSDRFAKDYNYMMNHSRDVRHTIALCRRRRTVVQAGSHVGIWPRVLAQHFKRVITFEVQPALQEACRRNCEKYSNILCAAVGLGEKEQMVPLLETNTLGTWRIRPEGQHTTQVMPLDDLCLNDLDALVLDIEGYEVEAMKGARQTIKRCHPVIHVEELMDSKEAIQAHLASIGYKLVRRVSKDAIYI